MKYRIIRVGLVNGILMALGALTGMFVVGGGGPQDHLSAILISGGLTALLLAICNVLAGFLYFIFTPASNPGRQWGAAMMLCGALLLLCSGTFCTAGFNL